jgi:peptide/nickel transport system substrate-binding protein
VRRNYVNMALAVLLSCGFSSGKAIAADPGAFNTAGTIVFFDSAGNETLDPAHPQTASSFSQEVPMALYDTLIRLNASGSVQPGLATSWSYNADFTEFTMKLRPGVTFHDGTKLTADVVKRNFERDIALGSRASAPIIDSFRSVASIEAIGDDTVRLKLKEPNGQMEYLFSFVAGMIVSPASFENDAFGATFKPYGAGPYKLKSFDSNVGTNLVRFDEYWNGIEGRPAAFEHHYVPDGRARLNALRSGQANIALIEPRQMAEAKGAGLEVKINAKNSAWVIYVNVSKPSVRDLRVRQAVMHAIDREALAEAFGFGSTVPTTQIFANGSPLYDAELDKMYPFDQTRARALLAEAGLKNGVDIHLLLLNTSEYRQLAEALQAMLGEVGIRLKFDTVDVSQGTLFRRPPPRGDIMLARWGGRPDPVQSFAELDGTGGAYKPEGVASPEIDRLIAEARRIPASNPERLSIVRATNKTTVENVSNFVVMSRSNIYASYPGCIKDLEAYLPVGDERFNDAKLAKGCR